MKILLPAVFAALLAACASSASARVHPDWPQRLPEIKHVIIVPPEVYVTRPDEDEDEAIEPAELREQQEELMSIAAGALQKAGFDVTQAEVGANAEFVQVGYRNALERLFRQREDFEIPEGEEGTYRISMGPVSVAAPTPEGEAVLCFRVAGMKRSFGGWLGDALTQSFSSAAMGGIAGALGSAITGLPSAPSYTSSPSVAMSACSVTVSMVDRRTGDLLWTDSDGSEWYSESEARGQVKRLVGRLSRASEELRKP